MPHLQIFRFMREFDEDTEIVDDRLSFFSHNQSRLNFVVHKDIHERTMAWVSQMVPRIGRKGSLVPAALIFWIILIVLYQQQPGVQGECQIQCDSNSHCEVCVPDLTYTTKCVTGDFAESTEEGSVLFNVTVEPKNSTIKITMVPESADSVFGVDGLGVFLNGSFDYENVNEYFFNIDCFDDNNMSMTPSSLYHELGVQDVNDNPPYFMERIINASIEENAEIGTRLITDAPIKAYDREVLDVGFLYSIEELQSVPFRITSGCVSETEAFLYLDGPVDFEMNASYVITVVAADGCTSGYNPLQGNVTVMVHVNDTDDEPPVFGQYNYDVTIPERNLSFVYSKLSASDPDTFNASLQYSFIGQSGEWGCLDHLAINPSTAEVTLIKELDYETSQTPCIITVQAVQVDNCEMVGNSTLTVTVSDVNECPGFMSDSYSGQLTYDDPFVITRDGNERLTIVMTDEDLTFIGTYALEPDDLVELVKMTGTAESRTRSYFVKFRDPTSIITDTYIQIFLSDSTTDVECDIATSNISVQLVSDSLAPNFTRIYYHGNVLENATKDTSVIQVEALNFNKTSEGIVYRLQMASDGGEYVFSVNDTSGDVTVAMNDSLDAESIKEYTLIIEAVDERGTYYRSSITSVIIDVLDVNEHRPMFNKSLTEVNIEEEVPMDFPVLTVQANDLDVDAALVYGIREVDVPFSIDQNTGEITTNGSLDRDEEPTAYNLTVTVTDGIYENESLVIINLTDINDNAPTFTRAPLEFSVQENTTNSATKKIEATDMDTGVNAEIVYSLESPDGDKFSISNETGLVYANGPFDYEEVKEYTLVIGASDGKFSTVTTVTVKIIDVNDNAPVFTMPCSIIEVPEDTDVDTVICTVVAVDADNNGADTVTYTLNATTDNFGFEVDSSTGEIKLSAELDRETQENHTFIITAEDSGQPPFSNDTTITVIVLDVNDMDPVFEKTLIHIRRQQDDLTNPPVLLESVKATDDDQPPWNIIICEKTSGEESIVVLTGEDGSCEIYAYKELSTSPDPYEVSFYAFNPDNRDRHSDNVTLRVDIRDTVCYVTFVNESNYDVIVLESELDASVPVLTLEVTSNCNSADITIEILSQSYQSDQDADARQSQDFTLNDQTGEILPKGIVMEGKHVLLVSAYNQSDPEVNETTTVSITVTGMNQAPEFGKAIYTVNITTDSTTMVIDLSENANDDDYPSFATGEIEFFELSETEVASGSNSEYFEVSPSGEVTTTQNNLNKIQVGTFELVVMVMDKAIEPLNDTAVVVINVDIDQSSPVVNPPIITKDCLDTVEIEEEMDPSLPVCDINASSSYDDQVVFGLDSASEYFTIEPDTGEITTKKSFDYETDERSYTLLVYAEGTTSKLRNYTSITVIIIDINDNPPDFSEGQLEFSMEENRHDATNCITFIGLIRSTDADSERNQNVTYKTDHEDFEVRGNNLTAVACISRNDIDYSTGEVEINITALNVGFRENLTTYVVIVVVVEDLNDYAPEFVNGDEDFTVVVEALTPDEVVFEGVAEDKDKGPYNNEVVFSLGFSQDDVIYALFQMSSNGVLAVRDISIINELAEYYEVIVMVMDKGQPPLNSTRIVAVYVGTFDLTTPYFPADARTQTIDVPENGGEYCHPFPVPLTCNKTDVQVQYELMVDPDVGKDFFRFNSANGSFNALCIQELDREVSSSYNVTITASYNDSDICNKTDMRTTRQRREAVEEVASNTITFTIIVNDVLDSPPTFQFPGNNSAYYLAAIDSLKFGSPVYTVTAKDEDASWQFGYYLTSLSGDDIEGPRDTITIHPFTGQITTNSLLYPWLSDSVSWKWKDSNFPASRTQDPYNVTVCDNSLGIEAPQCDIAPLTFKILLSFEHIIIRFNQPVASIMPKQIDIIRCIEQKMDPNNMLELNLQFFSPALENGISSPNQDMTDMWLYGVDFSKLPSSPYLKFDEFKSKWDETDGLEECGYGAEMTPTRLQLSKMLPESSTASAIEAWVPIALGIIVFIGNLICIILLLISWRTMMEDSGRELARELTIREEKVEKGIANPVFHYTNAAYEDTEIMATEAEEDAVGSEEPLITKVYVTDGKTQSTIAMTANDAPKDVEKAVGTDDDILILPHPPASRDYDTQEEMLNVYPFDEPDDGFDFKGGDTVDIKITPSVTDSEDMLAVSPFDKPDEGFELEVDTPGGTEDLKTTPDISNSAATPDRESSAKDPTQPVPPVDYETETKEDGMENEEKKKEDQEEDQDTQKKTGSIDGKVKTLMSELEGHFNKGKEDPKTTPKDGNDSGNTRDGESSVTDSAFPIPPVDYETETKNKDEVKTEGKKADEEAPTGASTSGVKPGKHLKDYDYPPPPVPLVQETDEDPLQESPKVDQDHPFPPPPPIAPPTAPPTAPPVPPIDYADGKTVTFGGETVVGEGAGDGGSTTASEVSAPTNDTNKPPMRNRPAFLSEIERVAASFGRSKNKNAGVTKGSPPPSPRSLSESEGESLGYLEDESLISASEIGVTSL